MKLKATKRAPHRPARPAPKPKRSSARTAQPPAQAGVVKVSPAAKAARKRELRTLLLARKRELLSRLGAEVQQQLPGEQPDTGFSESDLALRAHERALDTARVTRLTDMLRQVEAALDRLVRGTYGACADCGAEIAIARLQSLPFAVRCTACQEIWEASGKASGASGGGDEARPIAPRVVRPAPAAVATARQAGGAPKPSRPRPR
jgi:DnaK suppressor protein